MGTHEELLHKGGYYSRLYSMQFAVDAKPLTSIITLKLLLNTNQSLLRISHEIRTQAELDDWVPTLIT